MIQIHRGPGLREDVGILKMTFFAVLSRRNSIRGPTRTFSISSPGTLPFAFVNASTRYLPGLDPAKKAAVRTTTFDPRPGEMSLLEGLSPNAAAKKRGKNIRLD